MTYLPRSRDAKQPATEVTGCEFNRSGLGTPEQGVPSPCGSDPRSQVANLL